MPGAGAFVGGFIGVGVQMPQNAQAWDTFLLEHDDEVCVQVRLEDQVDRAELISVLRQSGATTVERFARP